MNEKWLEIACDIPAELADMLAAYLTELSGNGVCMENLNVDAFSHSEISHAATVTIKAYFDSNEDINARIDEISAYLTRLTGDRPDISVTAPVLSEVKSEDWSTSWKANFKPLHVGRRLLIVPTWEEASPKADQILLRLDPGMAFGTGGHETTRLCLELLEQVMETGTYENTPSVLDLGTGSGILAMAAVHLGAGRVCAVDIDPQAIEVAQENLAINNLSDKVECSTTPIESISATFDIILANILAEELVRLAPELTSRLNPAGTLILSGILAEKEELVLKGFSSSPLKYVETRQQGEWVAMLYTNGDTL